MSVVDWLVRAWRSVVVTLLVTGLLTNCGSLLGADFDQPGISDSETSVADAAEGGCDDCTGKCGELLGCGTILTCGGCPSGQSCGGGGPNICGTGSCTPTCNGKSCGASDGCEGICTNGSCGSGLHCVSGVCACDNTSCQGCCSGGACNPGTTCGGQALSGNILLFGGLTGGSGTVTADTWQWDGNNWGKRITSGPEGGNFVAMAVLNGQAVLFDWNNNPTQTWEWNANSWVGLVTGPSHGGPMATLGGKIVLLNGAGETWEWDGKSWVQRTVAGPSPNRSGFAMATLGNKVVLFGGVDESKSPVTVFGDTWEWDGNSWAKRTPAKSPAPHTGHAMATLGSKLLLYGGWIGPNFGNYADDTWEWDGTNWYPVTVSVHPPARTEPSMATRGSSIVLFGGYGATTPPDDAGVSTITAYDDTWEWNGSSWTMLTPASKPSARRGVAMATLP